MFLNKLIECCCGLFARRHHKPRGNVAHRHVPRIHLPPSHPRPPLSHPATCPRPHGKVRHIGWRALFWRIRHVRGPPAHMRAPASCPRHGPNTALPWERGFRPEVSDEHERRRFRAVETAPQELFCSLFITIFGG